MLPPVDPVILSANPRFEALYREICLKRLNQDGTTRVEANSKAEKNREAFTKDLRTARLESARQIILKQNAEDLQFRLEELPDELREFAAIVAATLGNKIEPQDRELVDRALEDLESQIQPLAATLSKSIYDDAKVLTQLFPRSSLPSIAELPVRIAQLQREKDDFLSSTGHARLEIAHEVANLHSIHRQLLEICIRHLEQTLHGSVSRAAKVKSDYLSIVAETMSLKLNLQHRQVSQQIYTPDVVEAMNERSAAIDGEKRDVKRKIREAEEQLELFERGGKGMKGMVKEYAEIMGELERVRHEVEKLKSA
ncbi:Hypothetical protein R9X50_00789100 [Acrodontium crateriforme]|uniref:Uncharacterized protein n=1 Tax=Acrodontium crateriforme TaxID=150365 RepID=A0AAQ3REC7_9PEZI|nr:Hypothetical protein R9X50_00789100 [Acrodontium crateriforme]